MFFPRQLPNPELAGFFHLLAIHTSAGLPAKTAFACLAQELPTGRSRRLASRIHARLQNGQALDAALALERCWGPVTKLHLQGVSDDALAVRARALADFLARRNGLDERIAYLNAWQKATLFIAFMLASTIMIFVIPAFKEVFASFGGELPALTQFIIAISDLFVESWYLVLAAWLLYRLARKFIPRLDRALGLAVLKLPAVGRKQRIVASAGVLDAAAFLESQGHDSANSIRCAATTLRNPSQRHDWLAVAAKVESGESVGRILGSATVVPLSVASHAALSGEGSLTQLRPVVDSCREMAVEFVRLYAEKSRLVSTITLSVLLGLLIIGVYLPIFKLGSVT
jgi:type IV pilus assembly protein PilC